MENDDKNLRIKPLKQQIDHMKEGDLKKNRMHQVLSSGLPDQAGEKPDYVEHVVDKSNFIQALVANCRTPLLILGNDLRVKTANKAFHEVFNIKNTDGILVYNLGNNHWNIPGLKVLLEDILPQQKRVSDYELRYSFSDLDERIMLLNAEEIANENSERSIILYIDDITEVNKAGEANAMLAAIVESSEDAIISKTLNGIVTSWNLAAEKLFGYTSAEMIGQPILKVIPHNRINEEPLIIRKIQNGETIAHFETQRIAKSKKLIDISLTISPIKDINGNIVGASKIARDISQQIDDRKKIEESEKRFHQLIFSSPTAIGILDGEELIITTANKPMIKIWGKDNDVIGKKYFDLLPELMEQGLPEVFKNVYKTGKPFNAFETPLQILQNGKITLKYYNYTLYPQYNLKNEINGIGIIASDVTTQALHNKSIKESEERFRSLTETLPQLIWVTDALGNSEFASSRWEEYSGIDPAAEGAWQAVLHPDEFERVNAAWAESLTTGIVYKSELRLKSKTGEYRWHSVEAANVKDAENKIVKWIGAFTDIHDQKLKEEKKDEFMGIASHEMKTPLTTAKAYLQMLEISLNESQKEAKLFAVKASQAVDRLNELIAELLDVSKIQFGKLNYTMSTFNFNNMIESTVENIQLTSPTSLIVKSGKVNSEIIGDQNRLQQVVINLLSNAIKYSPHSDKVFITLSHEKECITVAVKDNGIGIADDNLKKIFDKYHRVEEHAVQFQGMGVGLFISYEIIQRHGGNLWVESEVGKGSTFYFTLPVDGSAQGELISDAT